MSNALRLQYLFDPLCGWCYASAPALAGLAETCPDQLQLMPTGLFSSDGGRDMSPEWAHHAWTNDQRISEITGQVFSEAYHQQVLLGNGIRFDSTMLNRALTATWMLDAALEPKLLHELQIARYVHGRDTTQADVVTEISAAWAVPSGLGWENSSFAKRLQTDTELKEQTETRIRETQALMDRLDIRGVPQLLAWVGDDKMEVFSGASLYHGSSSLITEVRGRIGAIVPDA